LFQSKLEDVHHLTHHTDQKKMSATYILTRDPNEKEWKAGMTITPDTHQRIVTEGADHKFPLLTLLWFEAPRQANEMACWKVSPNDSKSNEHNYEYECQWGMCISLAKSFTLIERVVPDQQFDGILPITENGKAVFYHGFLIGTCLPDGYRGNKMSFVGYDANSADLYKQVDDLDAYLVQHPLSSLIAENSHVVRK
jgi:hypothetical protein